MDERQRQRRTELRRDLRAGLVPEVAGYVARSQATIAAQRLALALALDCGAVLITGESGTGKTSLVRWLATVLLLGDPLVRVCSRGSDTEWDDITGHNKGAYTGAHSTRGSVLDHDGAVLIDEIAEAPDATQVQLLRIVQDRQYRRAGADDDRGVACQLIAYATHSPERLRMDLRARLSGVAVHLLPLHQRSEDIAPLVVAEMRGEDIAPDALSFCARSTWPGNSRSLLSSVQRARALAMLRGGERVELCDIQQARAGVVAMVTGERDDLSAQTLAVLAMARDRGGVFCRQHVEDVLRCGKSHANNVLRGMVRDGLLSASGGWYKY